MLLMTSSDMLRDILLTAYDLGMGNGEFVFFGLELIKSFSEGNRQLFFNGIRLRIDE